MNQPPSGDGDDDMERRFKTGLQDDGRPSEAVRRAILDHASRMAVEHARGQPGGRRPAVLTARRRNTIFGALAAAVFAGLLVVPILRAPVVHKQSPVAQRPVAQGPVAPPPNRESAPQSAQAPEPQLEELKRNDRGTGAQRRITADTDKPKEAEGPALSSSNYASQAKSEPQAVIGGALSPAAPPAAPAMQTPASDAASALAAAPAAPAAPSRQLAHATTSSIERGEFFRGAAAAGNLTAVNAVLSSSFDVDARDRGGRTALMLAILGGHADVVDVLLASGAAVNAVDSSGVRPLQMARTKGNEAIIDSLLRAGAR